MNAMRLGLAGLICMVAAFAGCDQTSPASSGSAATGADESKPVVVATTTMIADLAQRLAGENAEVVGIMKTGEDPHVYDVRPRDAQLLASADLVLTNGLHLEATLAHVIEHNAKGAVVKLAEASGVMPLQAQGAAAGAPDPHAWMSVPNFKGYATAARDALTQLDPENADDYRARYDAYIKELDELDAWVRQTLDTVPRERRVIVTSHDAFNYFADAYGVEVHGVIGISTEQQPRPQDVEALLSIVRSRGVKALFIETSVSQTLNDIVRKVAADTGATIGGSLFSDSLGEPGTEGGTYIGMMRHNTNTMVEALK